MLPDWLRLMRVLARARKAGGSADPRCRVQKNVRASNGWSLDRYAPVRPAGPALLLLHGWTLRGKDDLRLQAFARSLASEGIECLVPNVPGLAALAFDPGDVLGLRALLEESPVQLGVVGFSFGGSYALLAASGCGKQPRFMVAVSSYGDLRETLRHWQEWGKAAPKNSSAREAWIYQKLVLAWRLRTAVGLSSPVEDELRDLLLSFCEGNRTEAAWAFFERALSDRDWEGEGAARQDLATLRALSLTEHPPRLHCPVVVLHDRTDEAVPASQADLVVAAVRRGSPEVRVDALITDLLAHVSPSLVLRPGEIVRFLRLLSPLVQK